MMLGSPALHPEGIDENSPGFQPWELHPGEPSPEGTADEFCLSRPFGTNLRLRVNPGLKPWAILIGPFGTKAKAFCSTFCDAELPLVLRI